MIHTIKESKAFLKCLNFIVVDICHCHAVISLFVAVCSTNIWSLHDLSCRTKPACFCSCLLIAPLIPILLSKMLKELPGTSVIPCHLVQLVRSRFFGSGIMSLVLQSDRTIVAKNVLYVSLSIRTCF